MGNRFKTNSLILNNSEVVVTGSNLYVNSVLVGTTSGALTGINSGNYIPKYTLDGAGLNASMIYQSGNMIGIGVTGFLSQIVNIFNNVAAPDGIKIDNPSSNGNAQAAVSFSYGNNVTARSRIGYFPSTNEFRIAGGGDNLGFITFYAGGSSDVSSATEKMRIQPGGNVGIKTTSPISNLDISGHLLVNNITGKNITLNNLLVSSGIVISGNAPVAFNSVGYSGQIALSGNSLLICTGQNAWGKITISAF